MSSLTESQRQNILVLRKAVRELKVEANTSKLARKLPRRFRKRAKQITNPETLETTTVGRDSIYRKLFLRKRALMEEKNRLAAEQRQKLMAKNITIEKNEDTSE